MNLLLKVTDGPLKDRTFELADGLSLGREAASVNLNDPKVSNLHAQVRADESGRFYLMDNASKNGIRVGEQKVELLELTPGVTFTIGAHSFEVISPEPPKPAKKQKYWNDILAQYIGSYADDFKDKARPVSPLEPALVLDFVRGPQVNSRWILGFGPRQVGAASLDLPIWEPGAPELCFEILPSLNGLVFRTAHPDKVLLNGESVDTQVLRMGDNIRISETLIEVDFTE